MQAASVTVPIGPCQCPGSPHDGGDTIDLRERLDFESGRTLQALPFVWKHEGLSEAAIVARLSVAYIEAGAVAWNLVDGDEKPVPLNPDTLREHLLNDFARAEPVADRADELYQAAVIAPLVQAAVNASPSTTTATSTSPKRNGRAKSRKPSSRSSTTTSATGVTATTSV